MIMEEDTKKSRVNYKDKLLFQLQCRVCLTQSNNVMFDLKDQLQLKADVKISYLEALRRVTSSEVSSHEFYPSSICPVCASLLKIAIEFIIRYESTELKLKEIFNCSSGESKDLDAMEEDENYIQPSVELIYKDKKFDVQQVVIVEEETPKTSDFRGFLNNLGREVTATFAKYQRSRKKIESEVINMVSVAVKEKDKFLPVKEIQIDPSSNQIEYIIEDTELLNKDDENIISENFCFVKGSNPGSGEETENVEYIEIDLPHNVINDFIIDKSKRETQNEVRSSVAEMERNTVGRLPSGLFQCEICDKLYTSWKQLCIHKNRVHFAKQKTFTCEICGTLCRGISAFIHHRLKHSERSFKCQLCNKSYFTKNLLKVHLEVHANRRQHQCRLCGAGFNYPNALVYHMRLHTGEKNYKCEICHRVFRMAGALNRHRRTHTDDRPYKCEHCDKRFRSQGEAKSHELIHTGRRPYECLVCPKSFAKSYNRRVHMLSHDGPHPCPRCPKGLVCKSLVSLHARMAHKEAVVEGDLKGGLEVEQDGLEVEQDGLEVEQDGLEIEQDGLEVEQDGLMVEQDGLEVEQDGLEVEQDGLEVEQDGLEVEQDGLVVEQDGLEVEQDGLEVELDGLENGEDAQKVVYYGDDLNLEDEENIY